jgi:2-polyprenyl-3-methyl-5-hydroxy-6-metoxy-1,4-benzoquinol methylase
MRNVDLGEFRAGKAPHPHQRTALQRFACVLASSFFFRKGHRLWEANSAQWGLPFSKWEKLVCGGYIILKDFAEGSFPPTFEDQAQAYQNEIDYNASLPGQSLAQTQHAQAIKPFWGAAASTKYLSEFNCLYGILQKHGFKAGDRLLELGCGCGWTAEFLALAGYSVLGTSISHYDVALANEKVASLRCKERKGQSPFQIEFLAWAMESVDEIPNAAGAFDGVYVYEALHHAFDWRRAVRAAAKTLKPGGWLLLANEPNRLHTFISYRVAKLSKTHEIGFRRRELVNELKAAGFSTVKTLRPAIDDWVTSHWIIARKD